MKKILTVLLALVVLLSSCNMSTSTFLEIVEENEGAWESGYESAVLINSLEEFNDLKTRINNGEEVTSGKYYVLTTDIDLSGETTWTPIGNATRVDGSNRLVEGSITFNGVFDGAGHTITLPTMSAFAPVNVEFGYGLFSAVSGENAAVKNLNVSGSLKTESGSAGLVVGILIGGATVDSVTTLDGSSIESSSDVGGIVGRMDGKASILNSTNNAKVITDTDRKAAGIVSCANRLYDGERHLISNCVNNGEITGSSFSGGIVGIAEKTTVENSVNNGKVTGHKLVGGIAGQLREGAVIAGCTNNGAIEGVTTIQNNFGGIAGFAGGYTVDPTLEAVVIKDSKNNGAVTASGANYVGGILGSSEGVGASLTNVSNSGDVTGNPNNTAGVLGYANASGTMTGYVNSGKVNGAEASSPTPGIYNVNSSRIDVTETEGTITFTRK